MILLALDGITSLSIKPLRIISFFGVIVSLLSFIGIVWAVIVHFAGVTVLGWASIVCIVCLMYVGKTYLEVKHRPRYIISERTNEDNEQK